jgi:hypothetical protein
VILALATALAADGQRDEARALAAALVRDADGREPTPPWLPHARELKEKLSAAAQKDAPAAAP